MSTCTTTAVCRWAALVGLVIWLLPWAVEALGEEPVAAIRRVLVPADRPETWPRNGKSLLPVEAREFETWLQTANSPSSSASIVAAEYQARWEDGALVGTRGSWEVQLQGSRAARLSLDSSTIAIRSPVWRSKKDLAARLGWWPSPNDNGFIRALEVPGSGMVDFEWDLPSPTTGPNHSSYLLSFPASARTKLALDLPADKQPIVESGVVVESPETRKNKSVRGRWVLLLGAGRPQRLSIQDIDQEERATKTTVIRQSVRYTVHRGGVDLDATLHLSAHEPLQNSIVFTLPSGMSLISAEADGQPLAWRAASRRVTIELPDAERGHTANVVLRAWGPLLLDELQRLPMLAVSDSFWASGEIKLAIDDSLELRELIPADCAQTAVEADDPVESRRRQLSFAAYAHTAAIEVAVRHRRSVGTVQSATSVVLGNPDVVGKMNSLVGLERGRLHRLTAELRPGWTVDAVETAPADALAEWYVDRSVDPPLLHLQLDRAIVPGDALRVSATAHMKAAATDTVSVADLAPLDWRLQSQAELLELTPAEQYDLEVHGEVRELSIDQVSAELRELLPGEPGARFVAVEEGTNATIRRVAKRIDYDATVEIGVALVDDRCDISYEIVCIPRGGGIDHALLFLDDPSSAPAQWIDADSERVVNVAKMRASDPRLGGLPDDGELCRLDFGRLYARPIRIVARTSIPSDERRAVPLVSLPDAASQQGRITVSSAGSALPGITAQNLSPAPFPWQSRVSSRTNNHVETRAVYRFQPTRFYDSASPPRLWVAHGDADSSPRSVATHIELESRYAADGRGVHRAVYQLSNQGAAAFRFSLAEDTILTTAQVDGTVVQVGTSNEIALPLPQRRREVVVELQLASRGESLANGVPLRSPLPATDNAHLAGEWRVKLPRGFAANDRSANAQASNGGWRWRLFGPLARRSDRPFNPLDLGDWNRMWITASSFATAPAQAASEVAQASGKPPIPDGMVTYRFAFGSSPVRQVVVSHWRSTTAIALAICLLTAVGTQLLGLRMRTQLWLALLTAAASLLAPVEWAPLATSATLGLLAAACWQWTQPKTRKRVAATALVAAAFVTPTMATAAQNGLVVESILVPVNADGKPVGTKYFVTDGFLRKLLAQADASPEPIRWLCSDMRCEGQLVSTDERKELAAGIWQLTLDCQVFGRDVPVPLPLAQNEANWQGTARVDGMPVPIVWNETGRGCSILIAEPGRRRVSLQFEPHPHASGSRQAVSLQLPAIEGAQVTVSAPPQVVELRSDDTFLVRNDQSQQTVWQGKLAADGRFSLSWPKAFVADVDGSERQVAQISRLYISPSGLGLNLLLVRRSGDAWPASVQVAVEKGWQLAPNEPWQVEHTETLNDGRELLMLSIPSTLRDESRLTLRFVAPERSPLGHVRPLAIEVKSLASDLRWLVVACDPQLECLPSQPISETVSSAPELAQIVESAADDRPNLVANLDQLPPEWNLAVRPMAALSSMRSRLSLAAGDDQLRVHFRCDVNPQGADRFGYSLSVPENLTIQSVTATERGEPLSLEWVRVDSGRVNVFFDQVSTEGYRIELRGRLPMPRDGLFAVPRIGPPAKADSSQTIALYREDNVTADWRFPAELPWVESGATLTNPFDAETHFVRAFPASDVSAPGVRVVVAQDEPAVSGETLTQIRRNKTSWEAAWSCRLLVERGTVDVLRLQVPAMWSGAFETTPSATTQFIAAASSDQASTLTLRLPQSARIGEEIRLAVRSPLVVPEGQLVSAPRIRLLADGERSDYLSLPTFLEGESLSWTRSGVEPTRLPSALQEPAATETIQSYQVTNDEFDVVLRPQPARTDLATVRLTETATFTGDEKNLHATRILLSPAGLDHCNIRMNEGQTLVHVSVNGHSALLHRLEPRLVEVQLDHAMLPQVIDVVIQSEATHDQKNRVTLIPPAFEQAGRSIPVDLSLWAIHGRFAGLQPGPQGCTSVAPALFATLRLDWLMSISQGTTRAALEVPAVDGYSWYLHWASALRTASWLAEIVPDAPTDTQTPPRVSPLPANSSEEAVGQAEVWIEQMAEFFRASELLRSSDGPNIDERLSIVYASIAGADDVRCFVSEDGQESMTVEFLAEDWTAAQTRYLVLGSLAVVAIFAIWASRRPQLGAIAENWPEIWGLVIGAAVWAWLRPSILGLLMAVVSAVLLLRRLQLREKSPRHDSSKLPNSNPDALA